MTGIFFMKYVLVYELFNFCGFYVRKVLKVLQSGLWSRTSIDTKPILSLLLKKESKNSKKLKMAAKHISQITCKCKTEKV
jgi:hypothetical protein